MIEGSREGYLVYKLPSGAWKKFWFHLDNSSFHYYNGPEVRSFINLLLFLSTLSFGTPRFFTIFTFS